MRIGVPKEIKPQENRIGLTPESVQDLTSNGHKVLVENNGGFEAGFYNNQYIKAGATIVDKAEDIFNDSEIIVKVKEPLSNEIKMIKENQIIFTYFHLAAAKKLTEDLGNTWYVSNEGLNDNSLYSLHLIQNNTVYAGGRYIHKSNSSIDECIDLSGLDFGPCAMALGIGYVNGECNYVSGCGWILNGIDYSDAFFNSMDECSSVCFEISFTLGDINNDSLINVQDIVLLVSFVLQIDFPTDTEFMAADYNGDGILNILDVVSIVELILNPQVSVQLNSGTSYGECWGYCVFKLELDNSNALFTASGWGWYEFPDLLLEDNLSQEMWQQIIELIDFEYFQSLDDVYGCPDCADGGAEFIEIIYDGVAKQVTFDAYTEIDGMQELTILLRDLRDEYWNQINENQECSIMPEVGPCDGICPTYYFNQNTNQCEEFITGCCGIEAFDSMQNCIDTCE